MKRFGTLLVGFAVVSGACTGWNAPAPTPSRPTLTSGGTLRVATSQPFPLDPQADYSSEAWEIYRCCLLRTLLSYNGRPTEAAGAELHPDLAAEMPTVAPDGLTWTFQLKRGVHYAPPLQGVEITARDIVRGLEREARVFQGVVAYGFYFAVIRGFREFADGTATSISGLEVPDAYTLRIRLSEPTGDLGYRLAMPAAAPIPPDPDASQQRLGVATGHRAETVGGRRSRGYLRFLVASGPYMIAGSPELDLSAPPAEEEPVAGYVPAKARFGPLTGRPEIIQQGHITLVRNPSWDPATDPLRPAYADRIVIATGFPIDEEAGAIENGRIDVLLGDKPDSELVDNYRASGLRDRVKTNPADFVFFHIFNLAQPPFDDVHVRKAASLVIDKARVVDEMERSADLPEFSPVTAVAATHLVMDSEEGNLLLTYDPYDTPGERGSVEAARAEMRRSRYDRNRDGICDAAACKSVLAVATDVTTPPPAGELMAKDLDRIGIDLRLEWRSPGSWNTAINDPSKHVALGVGRNWGKDYPNAFTFFAPLFHSDSLIPDESGHACCDWSLVGATPAQLRGWGYEVTAVPSVDARIDRCVQLIGAEQTECWAELDKYLMENVVPWVPYVDLLTVDVVSSRVASFSWDQFTTMPALDRIALKPSAMRSSE